MSDKRTLIPKNQFLLFNAGNQNYMVSTNKVISVARFSNISAINHPNKSIVGMTVVKGEIYSCLSLVNKPRGDYFIILDFPDINIGIIADKIIGFNEKPNPGYFFIDLKDLEKNGFNFSIISDDKCFYFFDGRKASSLVHFLEELKKTSDAVFFHHVNLQKNDFSEWILHVIKNEKLAEEIRNLTKKEEMISIIQKSIEY